VIRGRWCKIIEMNNHEAQARRDAAHRVVVLALFLSVMASIIVASFTVTPGELERGEVVLSPPCLSRQLLQRPCLHCGLSRAFAAMSHGDVARALGYNRLVVLFYLLVWGSALAGGVAMIRAFRQYIRLVRVHSEEAP